MINKHFILFFLLLVGFLFIPTNSYACESKSVKTEKECCKKNTSDRKCCSKNKSGSKQKGCSGKCGHSNCTVTSSFGSMAFPNHFQFEIKTFGFYLKQTKFIYTNYNLSSGYVSLWLIPKIS
jgi:hypothetical protein